MDNTHTYDHRCIKPDCPNSYMDNDPDDYYCPSCQEANKVIAKQIDAKLKRNGPREPVKSDYQLYEEIQKKTGQTFISAKHFGI